MGNGIAHVAAAAGYVVHLQDVSAAALDKARATIEGNLARQIKKGALTEAEGFAVMGRIHTSTEVAPLGAAQLVIEAATEARAVKLKIFEGLGRVMAPQALLASNTSSISITDLAAHTDRPEQFMGMHFMNPVPVMKLVELIRGVQTSDTTCAVVTAAAERMGKTTVLASKDVPGFIVNRVLMPYINEAAQALYEGVATREDIDTGMKLGTNVPMGPLTLADFIGLDTCLAIMDVLYHGFRDSKYRASPLLVNLVAAGHLGRKSGRGFYTY
ncbi:MAG: 3-hydroxybutyryl-CoA dehydrogenase [Deltaproteobacteria bacterium]|nr:3-hydroxybutyryl-CoA dehydrogenase [Deltaproteobacteria bacterium]